MNEFQRNKIYVFRAFDTDGDGKISKEEFRICMLNFGERFGDDEINDMVKEADNDKDGSIDFEKNPHIAPVCLPDVFQVQRPYKIDLMNIQFKDNVFNFRIFPAGGVG